MTASPRRRLRWRADDAGGLALSVPGQPSVRLVILCWSCWKRGGTDRRLAVLEMDTGDGADRALWVRVFSTSAGRAVPAWHGVGDTARLRLTCGIKSGPWR